MLVWKSNLAALTSHCKVLAWDEVRKDIYSQNERVFCSWLQILSCGPFELLPYQGTVAFHIEPDLLAIVCHGQLYMSHKLDAHFQHLDRSFLRDSFAHENDSRSPFNGIPIAVSRARSTGSSRRIAR